MESSKEQGLGWRQRLFKESPHDEETYPWLGGVVPVALLIVVAIGLTFFVARETGAVVLGGALFFYQHAGGRRQAELLARIEQLEAELKAARAPAPDQVGQG